MPYFPVKGVSASHNSTFLNKLSVKPVAGPKREAICLHGSHF